MHKALILLINSGLEFALFLWSLFPLVLLGIRWTGTAMILTERPSIAYRDLFA